MGVQPTPAMGEQPKSQEPGGNMLRRVCRWVVVGAVLLALLPMTAFADGSAGSAPTGASTQADVLNATAIYNQGVGVAMARAENDMLNARGIAMAHPGNAADQAQFESAAANYAAMLQSYGVVEAPAPSMMTVEAAPTPAVTAP